jgi:hypothetical protein
VVHRNRMNVHAGMSIRPIWGHGRAQLCEIDEREEYRPLARSVARSAAGRPKRRPQTTGPVSR